MKHTFAPLVFVFLVLLQLNAIGQIENVKVFTPGSSFGQNAQNLIAVGNTLYFRNWNAATGLELWKSDGTDAGTVLVKDINPGAASGAISNNIVGMGGIVYFIADDGVHGAELWRSDGTESGTYLIEDILPGTEGSNMAGLAASNDRVLFKATMSNPGTARLFVTDGTPGAAEYILAPDDIVPADLEYTGSSRKPVIFNNRAYFMASISGYQTSELWSSSVNGGYGALVGSVSNPIGNFNGVVGAIAPANDKLFLTGGNYTSGWELYVSDGTSTLTEISSVNDDFNNGAELSNLITNENTAYFFVGSGTNRGLWKSDGTQINTSRVKEIGVQNFTEAGRKLIAARNNEVFFAGFTAEYGTELWISDGTDGGTRLVKDINPGTSNSLYSTGVDFKVIDGILYFIAERAPYGEELWRSDGTEDGTYMIMDKFIGASNSFSPLDLTKVGNYLYMLGQTSFSQYGLARVNIPTPLSVYKRENTIIQVWPNPAAAKFNLRLPENSVANDYQITITDAMGRSIPFSEIAATNETVQIEILAPKGLYLVNLLSKQNHLLSTRVMAGQ